MHVYKYNPAILNNFLIAYLRPYMHLYTYMYMYVKSTLDSKLLTHYTKLIYSTVSSLTFQLVFYTKQNSTKCGSLYLLIMMQIFFFLFIVIFFLEI